MILEWHARAKASLVNYGDEPGDRRRSASLNEIWARELAGLDEAQPSRTFKKCLSYEHAYSLKFVSQALRQVKDNDREMKILDEADGLVRDAAQDPAAAQEEPKSVRELLIGLKMERAWLLQAMGDRDASQAALLHAWSEVEPGDRHNANLLGNVLGCEMALEPLY